MRVHFDRHGISLGLLFLLLPLSFTPATAQELPPAPDSTATEQEEFPPPDEPDSSATAPGQDVTPAPSQDVTPPVTPAPTQTVTGVESAPLAAGLEYKASDFHEFLFGEGWRDLWTTPVNVPVLDLGTYAGGLRPVKKIGGRQSQILALEGSDGRSYTLRMVNKDQSGQLPPAYKGSSIADLIQDQTGSQHPIGNVIAGSLAKAAGIWSTEPQLIAVPDDPRLGEFQAEFRGQLATIEEYPTPAKEGYAGYRGATEIVSTKEMWERWLERPDRRVSARAYLRARLFDLFINDWDRHSSQWRFALAPGASGLQPLPEDRDQAFSNYGGTLVRSYGPLELLPFHRTIPDVHHAVITAWGTDRLILSNLERDAYRAEAQDLRSVLTDAVIQDAVLRMPEPYRKQDGESMIRRLKGRRDRLVDAAGDFYRILAHEVDVHATDQAETARIAMLQDGSVELTLGSSASVFDGEGQGDYFQRVFHPSETDQVRLYLHGGDDRVLVSEEGRSSIRVFVMGGQGADRFQSRSVDNVRFMEVQRQDEVQGEAWVDRKPYRNPRPHDEMPWREPRNWGRSHRTMPYFMFERDDLLSIGIAYRRTRYDFRVYPFRRRHQVTLSYGLGQSTFRLAYGGVFRPRHSDTRYMTVDARFSTSERTNFFGLGNESPELGRPFYISRRPQFSLQPSLVFEPSSRLRVRTGIEATYRGKEREDQSFVATLQPYGSGSFGQAGFMGELRLDGRNKFPPIDPGNERWTDTDSDMLPFWSGFLIRAKARAFPAVWDVEESFTTAEGSVAGYAPLGSRNSLAGRLGGKKIWGDYPWHEAAFLGGSHVLRSFKRERFAGDASAYGSVELRTKVGKWELIAPGHWGTFVFVDEGRVFVDGEDSSKWHNSIGGGFFFVPFNTNLPFHVGGGYGSEGARFYFDGGFSF